MVKDRLMTTDEVAAYLSCSISTVRRLVSRGQIPHYRLGRMLRFRRGELDAWLAQHRDGEPVDQVRTAAANDQLSLFDAESLG